MLKDRVQETTTTTGTGNFTLTNMPAATGFSSFNTAFGTGAANIFFYVVTMDAEWEAGIAYLSAASTMVRTAGNVLAGSAGAGVLTTFSAGTKYVFNTAPADRYTNWRDANLERPAMKNYTEVITAMGTGSGPRAMDLSTANIFTATKNNNTTWSFSNVPSTANRAVSCTLILTNGGTGTGTNAWTGVKWSFGVAPTLTNGGIDILTFMTVDNGATWHGMLASCNSF